MAFTDAWQVAYGSYEIKIILIFYNMERERERERESESESERERERERESERDESLTTPIRGFHTNSVQGTRASHSVACL